MGVLSARRGTRSWSVLRQWFWASYLVTTHTPGLSALQLQRQLGIGRYETAWAILHKLRSAMGRPDREPLHEKVEVDETYVGGSEVGLRDGRELLNKTRVVGAVGKYAGLLPGRSRRLGAVPDRLRKVEREAGEYRRHRWLAELRPPRGDGIPPSPAHPEGSETGRDGVAAGPSCFRDPQNLAARDSPWGPTPPSPGLPGRVHLPLQPAPDSDGSRSHPARPRGQRPPTTDTQLDGVESTG